MRVEPQLGPPLFTSGCCLQNNLSVAAIHSPNGWMNSQRAPSITAAALNTSINPTPNPFLSRQGVVYIPAQLQLPPSLGFDLSLFLLLSLSLPLSISLSLHSVLPLRLSAALKSFQRTLFCCSHRLLVPPSTQPFTCAGFGHAQQPLKSPWAMQS